MKCSGCGQDFPNLNALTRHKEVCPAKIPDIKTIIPLILCPDEIRYYATGNTVGLRIEGKYTAEGIEVQEVTLVR